MGNSWHKNRLNSMLKLSTYNGANSHLSSHPATMSPSCDNPGSGWFQRGRVWRPDARPQRRAFFGIGNSSLHEFAGEKTLR